MPIDLSIENAPEAVVQRLRDRAARNHGSLQDEHVVPLAAETGLTAYDASYLWLSRHLNAELVTLDRKLAKAALPAR
jgi:predicted nucleic acid-binding protein